MKQNVKVNIKPLTRVEGHGNIKISIKDGRLEEANWEDRGDPAFFRGPAGG